MTAKNMANMRQSRGRERGRSNEPRDEFDQVTLDLARVTRVMAGGKRMRFRACIAVGDRKGRIGLGLAKGADVSLAISKAAAAAKKNLVKVKLTEAGTIPHTIRLKLGSAKLLLKPAPAGSGIIAGSVLRQIFELAGVRDVAGKILGTNSKINNAKALIKALAEMRPPKEKSDVSKNELT